MSGHPAAAFAAPARKMKLLQRPLSALPNPSEAVRHFAPSWFTIVMGTGIVGALIGAPLPPLQWGSRQQHQ